MHFLRVNYLLFNDYPITFDHGLFIPNVNPHCSLVKKMKVKDVLIKYALHIISTGKFQVIENYKTVCEQVLLSQ